MAQQVLCGWQPSTKDYAIFREQLPLFHVLSYELQSALHCCTPRLSLGDV